MPTIPLYYRVGIACLKSLYQLKLRLKATTKPDEIAQRYAKHYPAIVTERAMIWCHAVSLGETNTAVPIFKGLLDEGYALWITNTTHTGFERVTELFADEIAAGIVYQSFVPIDDASVIERFIEHTKPIAALFIETELWAITLAKLAQHHIASVVVNARLSASSFAGYQRVKALSHGMMANLSLIIAQDADSAKRFRQLGASSDKIRLAPSLKWSSQVNPAAVELAQQLQQSWQLGSRVVIVAASTHEGEEQQVIAAAKALQTHHLVQQPLWIIVPRHPDRFEAVADLIAQSGVNPTNTVPRRSQASIPSITDSVYLADSMGELGVWYALADIAIVCGSLVDIGGHNPIEAAILAKPIIMGQYTQSCQQLVHQLKAANALIQVEDEAALVAAIQVWLDNPAIATQAGLAGQALAKGHQDANECQLAMIKDCLAQNEAQRISQQIRLIDNLPAEATTGKTLIDDFDRGG